MGAEDSSRGSEQRTGAGIAAETNVLSEVSEEAGITAGSDEACGKDPVRRGELEIEETEKHSDDRHTDMRTEKLESPALLCVVVEMCQQHPEAVCLLYISEWRRPIAMWLLQSLYFPHLHTLLRLVNQAQKSTL